MTKKFKNIAQVSLSLPPSMCVCVCGGGGWVHVCKEKTERERERAREREKGKGARGVIRRQRLHEFSHFIIISLPCPLGPHNPHTAHSHSTIGQHCGLKAVIY